MEAGLTLFEPSELKLNMDTHQEEDEEVIEDQKRRAELLKKQLDNAFDDWTDDDDPNDEERVQSSCSSQGDGSRQDVSNYSNGGRGDVDNHYQPIFKNNQNIENSSNFQLIFSNNPSEEKSEHLNNDGAETYRQAGMIFHKLSDISERSPNQSGYHSLEVSKDSTNAIPALPSGKLFSPSRSMPYKFVQMNGGNSDHMAAMGGRGDADNRYQPMFKNNQNIENNEKFQPIFSNNVSEEKSENFNNDSADAYRQADYNSVEQLQVLYEVRLREIQRLSEQLEEERVATASYKQEVFRKMALLEAEKERAVLSRTEASKLLVASKEELSKLQKEVHSLKQSVATFEKEKTATDELMELSKVHTQELEQRIALMERCDSNKNFVKQTDIMIKELKNKHQQEVHLLQRQAETLNKKLLKKEDICVSLEQKVAEMQRANELLLVDKTDTINQLAHNLEESQAQCGQLMATNMSVDNVRLQNQLQDALREKEELNKTVKNLQAECSMMRSDLVQYETVSKLTFPQSHSSSDETDSIIQLGMSSQHSKRTNINVSDMSAKLKEELHRALLSQKAKRAEIYRLKELVSAKENQIQQMMEQERNYLAQTETLNEQLNKMMVELNSLHSSEKKYDTSDKTEEISTLNTEIAELRKDKAALEREKLAVQKNLDDLKKQFEVEKRREISDYNKEYLKFHDETVAKVRKEVEEEADIKIKEYSLRLEHSLKEVSEVKEMYVAVCAAKEQLTQSLSEATAQLQQTTAERDQLAVELENNRALRDQLARRLNESAVSKAEDQTVQRLREERDKVRVELDKCVEMRDQLARRVNTLKRENDELAGEIQRLKTDLVNCSPQKTDSKLSLECAELREELSAMSARHTQELSSVRMELQGARDRVVQLERSARLQFETEIKSLRQDRDMLKTKCDEKEVQIKKLIDSRKRPPAMVSVATETDLCGGEEGLEERHRRELARCREEYHNTLAVMEQAQHEARSRYKEDVDRLQETLEAFRQQVEQQGSIHREQLLAVEERTKQLTVKYFAEEVKRLETKYIEEASRRPDPTVLEALQKTLIEKNLEIESLKQRLASLNEECHHKVATLQRQMEEDRDNASQLMVQWSQEVKNIQGELKLKEAIIDDQRSKIEKAQSLAKRYRNKLMKTNHEITSQYLSKCAEYKARMQEIIEENEKAVFEKIKQLEHVYEEREKEIKKKMSKKHHLT